MLCVPDMFPVWIIKPQAPKAYRRILAAVDVDDVCTPQEMEGRRTSNHQILEMTSSLALADRKTAGSDSLLDACMALLIVISAVYRLVIKLTRFDLELGSVKRE
jgi:nucleotide-binding universal stress UspA family protein